MSKARITVRLYRMHDLDLITFVELHKLNLNKAVYCALTAFTNGELFFIKIPEKRDSESILDLKRVYSFNVILDTDKDKAAIDILNKITKGKKNNFLKNLLRLYLCNPMSECFLENEDDASFFYEKFEIFRKGKKFADLSENTPKKRNSVPLKNKKEDDTNKTMKEEKESIIIASNPVSEDTSDDVTRMDNEDNMSKNNDNLSEQERDMMEQEVNQMFERLIF